MFDAAVAQAPPAKGFKGTLIELAIVMLIGAGVGAAFEMTRPDATGAAKPGDAMAITPQEPATILDLPPVVTNLGSPQDTWIRLEASIVFNPKVLPHPEAVVVRIGDDVLAYLRTVSLKQLEGPIGLEHIRQDLNERAQTRSGGKIRELVIRTLVVQ
jgi:flagellar FliL protein